MAWLQVYVDLWKSAFKIDIFGAKNKNGCKNEFKDNNENHAADPEIGSLGKSILKSNGRATTRPPAWKLRKIARKYLVLISQSFLSDTNTVVYWNSNKMNS